MFFAKKSLKTCLEFKNQIALLHKKEKTRCFRVIAVIFGFILATTGTCLGWRVNVYSYASPEFRDFFFVCTPLIHNMVHPSPQSGTSEISTSVRRVAIQGVQGAFHEVAARYFFEGEDLEIVPSLTFEELVARLEQGEGVDTALMAIENTLAGSLMANYRLLDQGTVCVVGELHLRIAQNLMALPGQHISEIRQVYSHPIAIAQCRDFFKPYPHIHLIETEDTALSARMIRENQMQGAAAIAGVLAAELYQLEILAHGIETNKKNYTRFLVLEKKEDAREIPDADKVSMSFSVNHEVGGLYKILAVLAAYQVNLTKIQSAPIIGKPWEYLFFVDFVTEGKVGWKKAIEALQPLVNGLKIHGAYRQGKHYA